MTAKQVNHGQAGQMKEDSQQSKQRAGRDREERLRECDDKEEARVSSFTAEVEPWICSSKCCSLENMNCRCLHNIITLSKAYQCDIIAELSQFDLTAIQIY